MNYQQIIDIIYEMRAEYSIQADDKLKIIGNAVLHKDMDNANEYSIQAAQCQAKVEVLDELLGRIED